MGHVGVPGKRGHRISGGVRGRLVRRRTPRAALLSTLPGIAIGFISMTFALRDLSASLVAMLPLAVILMAHIFADAVSAGVARRPRGGRLGTFGGAEFDAGNSTGDERQAEKTLPGPGPTRAVSADLLRGAVWSLLSGLGPPHEWLVICR